MLPTQITGTPQTQTRGADRGQGSAPKREVGQAAPQGPGKEKQTRQGEAAAKTETKRVGARKALSEYNGKVRKHQQSWVRENRAKSSKTQGDQQAAQQSAWDGSQEGQEARQTLMLPLTEYNGAVEHELRLAADGAGSDAEAIRQAVEKKAKEIQTRTNGGAEDKILDDVVDRAAPRVAGESPEMRSQALDLAKLISTRDQAAANLKAIQERRDRDLASVTNPQWRQKISEGSQAEITAAQKVLTDAEQALASALKRELSIDVSSNALIAAKLGLADVGKLPADRQPVAKVAALAKVTSAQLQFDQVRAGTGEVTSFTPEQVDQALQTVLARHPELMAQENAPLATDLLVNAESLKVRAKIDTNLATLSADQNTPDWMKRLIATDKVTAAMAVSLGVHNLRPDGGAEEGLAKASPLTFAVLKYAGGGRFDMPAGTMANPAPTDVLRAGQEETAKRLQALQTADPAKFAQLQLLMLASGDARVSYIRAEWQRVVAAETPEQSVEKMLGKMLREGDFNNPDYTPPTEIGKFMKSLSVNMLAAFTPEQQLEIWNAVGGDVTAYVNRQADHIKARHGEDFAMYPTALGEWQKQMAQFAPPPVAGVLVDATIARVDPLLIGRPGGSRITQGLQLLGDRAPQSVGKMASWLAGTKNLPIRQLIPVQRDGTGAALSRALIAQYRQNGMEPRAVADMESLYQASIEDLQQERGAQQVTEQFKLFNQNRNVNLQNIFDTALRDGGTLFTQRQNFGNDLATDAAYAQRLGFAPDNPNAGPGQAQYTDPVKLERIRTLKQIDMISRALNLPVDMNALTPLIASGQALPRSENLDKINKLREWVREAGGENAFVTFTPAVYVSEKQGVSPLHLLRVEGDKNKDGVITREEATRERPGSWTAETLDDEDVVIDASMLTAAARGQNVPWKYTDFENFRKDNLLDDEGKLYLTGDADFLLHDANGDGRVDNINFEGVDAAITTGWETTRRWGDVVIGVAGLVAGVALIVGTGGLAAPVVAGGAAVYFGARTVETGMEMANHGQSFNPINTAEGAWLGFIDPAAGGLWLGGIASVSGLGALRPLALGKSLVGLSQTGTFARGATTAAGASRNIGTELFLSKGLQTSIYQAQLATVSKPLSWTAQGSGGLMTIGQGQDFVRAASNGEIDWSDWSLHSSTWDFAMMGGGVASFGAGYAAAAHARGRGQTPPTPPPDNTGQNLNILGQGGGDSPIPPGETGSTPPLLGEAGQTTPPPQGDGGATPLPTSETGGAPLPEGGGGIPPANTDATGPGATLTAKQVAALKGEGLAALTPDVPPELFANINPNETPNLTRAQIETFTRDQVAALPTPVLTRLSADQLHALGKNISRIAPKRLARLSPEQIAALDRTQMGWLTVHQIAKLKHAQLKAFTPAQLSALTLEQRHALTPNQRKALSKEQNQAIDRMVMNTPFGDVPIPAQGGEQVSVFRRPLHKLTVEEIPTIAGQRLAKLSPDEMALFSPDQIRAFTREQQMWITLDQMAGFTAEQLAAFHPLQLGAFTPEQRGVLTETQTASLNEAQAGALEWRWMDGAYGPISMSDLVPSSYNNFAPKTLTGLPQGRISSPIHEVAHTFPGRLIRTLQVRGGVEAAARVLEDRQNVMLVTGFSVDVGKPETDGPPGTALLGRILRQSGKQVSYVVDEANAPVLRATLEALGEPVENIHIFRAGHEGSQASEQAASLLDQVKPDAVMAIELPARNVEGVRRNMRGLNINDYNPPLDALLLLANQREGIVTLGVGDGGNEAGMGVVRDLVPLAKDDSNMASDVPAQHLITASVSNWGAEAIGVAYATLIGRPELIHTLDQQFAAIDASARAGAVDGVSREYKASVDGMSWEAHQGWFIQLKEAADRTQLQPIYLALMDSSDGGLYAARTFAANLTEKTGRRVVRVLGLDHGNATYGNQYRKAGEAHAEALELKPSDAAYEDAYVHGGRVRIGQLTNDVLTTLQTSLRGLNYSLSGEASNLVIAMACNTACTGLGYKRGVNGVVVDLVDITARQMVETGGNHPVSLSTSGTESVHAYREAVTHRIREQIADRTAQLQAEGLTRQQIEADPDIIRLNNIRITEIGASANPILGPDGKPVVVDGLEQTSPDLAGIVNRLNTNPPPSQAEIQAAVTYYVRQIPPDATSVWLTCTHYPALIEHIQTALKADGRNIPVIDPMIHQVDATIKALGITTLDKRPAHFQRSPAPTVVTSGNQEDVSTSARAVLGREDVRVVHVEGFDNVSGAEYAQIRHSIFRANNPMDGTLHEFSKWNAETGKWEAVEVHIRDAEAEAYGQFDKQGALQPEYENVLRAIAGYGPITPGDAAPPTPPTGDAPPPGDGPPPPPPPGDGPPPEEAKPQGVMVHVKEYGPYFLTTGILAATVPPEYLVVANGASWVVRGAGMLPIAIWPKTFALNTRAGRALKALSALTFVGNGAYHGWTYVDGSGAPMNQLYALSDHGTLAQNVQEARTGVKADPPKWAKIITHGASNAANGLLLPLYSMPVGFEAWGPNLLFGGGTAYLTYRAFDRGKNHNPIYHRVATGAVAVGLMTFGATYLMRLSEERSKGPQNGQIDAGQAGSDQTGFYDELFTRPIEGNVYATPFGRVIIIEQDGVPSGILLENGPLRPAKEQADANARQSVPH
jgi:glutamate racemase